MAVETATLLRLVRLIKQARHAVALTGAGVSTDSGIPDFRSPGGLWNQKDPMAVASVGGLRANPRAFYAFWRWRFGRLAEARPNVTHRTLAALERQGLVAAVITQNIDGLHRRAGSERVIEVHGSYERSHCLECGADYPSAVLWRQIETDEIPTCHLCGGLVKPAVILFGEAMPPAFNEALALVRKSDLLLVLGSSLVVHPVAELVPTACAAGARLAILNRDATPYDSLAEVLIHDDLASVMTQLAVQLELNI